MEFAWLTSLLFGYFVLRTVGAVGVGMYFVFKTELGQKKRIYRVDYHPDQFRRELKAVAGVVVLDAFVLATLQYFDVIPYAPFTWSNFLITYGLLYLWYEVWFYWTHRIMHHPRLFWIHRQHHVAKVTHPLSAMSFSILERIILLVGIFGFALAVLPWIPICFEGVVAYGVVNILLNVLGHSNVEINTDRFSKSWVAKVINCPTYHALHHARMNGHYGLFTSVQDYLFGTTFPDALEMQAQAGRGEGFDRISAKPRSRLAGDQRQNELQL